MNRFTEFSNFALKMVNISNIFLDLTPNTIFAYTLSGLQHLKSPAYGVLEYNFEIA